MRKIVITILWVAASFALVQMGATAYAQQPLPPQNPQEEPADSRAVQAFIDKASGPCEVKPAQVCIDLGWQFAVAQPKQGMTLADLKRLRTRLGAWLEWHKGTLPVRARSSIGIGMLLADGVTMERLHAAFDADHNGYVTQKELFADVKLDSRPLGVVLADPVAVDRAGFARRVGLPPQLTGGLFPQQEAQRPGN
jgi:hypothetical protein